MRCSTAKITAINIVYIIILSFIFIIACTEKAIVGEAASLRDTGSKATAQGTASGKAWTVMIHVKDDQGAPVPHAKVTLKERLKSGKIKASTLKTSSAGNVEFKGIEPEKKYSLQMMKAGYKPKTVFLHKDNPEVNYLPRVQRLELELTLFPIKSLKKVPESVAPATISNGEVLPGEAGLISTMILESPHDLIFRTTAQEQLLVHYPIPHQQIISDVESIDAILHILPRENAVFPKQSLEGFKKFEQKNVQPYTPSLFRFKVDSEGTYLWHLSYVMNFKNGTKISYPSYTEEMLKSAVKKENSIPEWGYFFLVVPPQPEPQYQEVIPNHNDKNDANRINLLFIRGNAQNGWESFGADELPVYTTILQEIIKGKFGPLNVEPFKSNLNQFNFWYTTDIATPESMVSPYDFVSGLKKLDLDSLDKYQKYRLGTSLPNLILVRVDAEDTGLGGKSCYPTDSIILYVPVNLMNACHQKMGNSWEQCAAYLPLSRVLSHELGHTIARLPEEYAVQASEANPFFDQSYFQEYYDFEYNLGVGGDTAFYTGLVDKEKDCKVGQLEVNCIPNVKAVEYCQKNARWKDLIGNGCGQEGVVDCPENKFEVSCAYTSAGWPKLFLSADITKSTKSSIMEERSKFLDVPIKMPAPGLKEGYSVISYYDLKDYASFNGRFFGQVNERQLCRHIKLYTGSAEGICNTLCMEGCSNGQKCLNGTCQTG